MKCLMFCDLSAGFVKQCSLQGNLRLLYWSPAAGNMAFMSVHVAAASLAQPA